MRECFLLAGGQSKRFGEDKLLFEVGGKRVIEHVVERLRKVCDRLCVVAKEKDKFAFLKGVELLQDLLDKHYALAGLYTALKNMVGEKALVISGDMPLIKPEVVQFLFERAEAPLTLYSIRGKLYPLFAIYYRAVLEELEEYISSGGERLMGFINSLPYKAIKEEEVLSLDPKLASFINMNTKAEAELIIKLYGEGA